MDDATKEESLSKVWFEAENRVSFVDFDEVEFPEEVTSLPAYSLLFLDFQ